MNAIDTHKQVDALLEKKVGEAGTVAEADLDELQKMRRFLEDGRTDDVSRFLYLPRILERIEALGHVLQKQCDTAESIQLQLNVHLVANDGEAEETFNNPFVPQIERLDAHRQYFMQAWEAVHERMTEANTLVEAYFNNAPLDGSYDKDSLFEALRAAEPPESRFEPSKKLLEVKATVERAQGNEALKNSLPVGQQFVTTMERKELEIYRRPFLLRAAQAYLAREGGPTFESGRTRDTESGAQASA